MWRLVTLKPCLKLIVMVTLARGIMGLNEAENCYRHDEARMPQLTVAEYRLWEGTLQLNPRAAKNFKNEDAPDACRISCLQKNSKYFALRKFGVKHASYSRCYCGNQLPGDNVDQGRYCNYGVCGGYKCGGALSRVAYSNVYEVFASVGCAVVSQPLVTSLTTDNPAGACRERCIGQGAPLFGIRKDQGASTVCLCFNETHSDLSNLSPNVSCGETCQGVPCGGADGHTSIYSTCPLGRYPTRQKENLCSSSCDCPHSLCHLDGTCITLTCPAGFQGTFCQQDVNECDIGNHTCGGQGHCENTRGSYYCRCNQGYQPDPENKTCVDIDECSKNSSLCPDGQCVNLNGSYRCDCNQGYQPTNNNQSCKDIDECHQDTHNCSGKATCNNTRGSFQCMCPDGSRLTQEQGQQTCTDIDECKDSPDRCGPGKCMNKDPGYTCDCDQGYQLSQAGDTCVDFDECDNDTALCSPNGNCSNTQGSYRCVCTTDGYIYNTEKNDCEDRDECAESPDVCGNGECNNTDGSFWCQCDPGYTGDQDCTDIDECLNEEDNSCPQNPSVGKCINTAGDYKCECTGGYKVTNQRHECTDVIECEETKYICGSEESGKCENTEGSYYCNCSQGYKVTHDNKTCEDVDECQDSADTCPSRPEVGVCKNTPGDYYCQCRQGYVTEDNGHRCTDKNECVPENPCGPEGSGACVNVNGSYFCSCNSGYEAGPQNKTCTEAAVSGGSTSVVIAVVVLVLAVVAVAVIVIVIRRRRNKSTMTPVSGVDNASPGRQERTPAATVTSNMALELNINSGAGKPIITKGHGSGPSTITLPGVDGRGATKIDIHNKINHQVQIQIHQEGSKPSILPKPCAPKDNTEGAGPYSAEHANIATARPEGTCRTLPKFLAFVSEEKTKEEPYKGEYGALPSGPTAPWDKASLPELKPKNRFKNILPYDHSRVKLSVRNNDPLSDYINASYLQGYIEHDKFIAALGPRPATLGDFWRMVWEQKCHVIVMLTNLVEAGVNKCEQYWPESGVRQYEDVTVRLVSKEIRPEHTIKKLHVSKKDQKGWSITHYHFTVWPDHGVPRYASALLQFRRYVARSMVPGKQTIVHCSAGIGRTGTMIALDMLLKQIEAEKLLDVFGCVENLRKQRVGMVQTWQQYVFLHDALVEYLEVGETCMPSYSLHEALKSMTHVQPDGRNKYEHQLKLLTDMSPLVDVYDTKDALSAANKHKNRDMSIVPQSCKAPALKTPVDNRNNYINAVYVNGFLKKDGFIATQIPLEDTVVDLWRLLVDCKVQVVICIYSKRDQENIPQFLPTEGAPVKVANMTCTLKSTHNDIQNGIQSYNISVTTSTAAPAQPKTTEKEENADYINTGDIIPSKVALTSEVHVYILWQPDNQSLITSQGSIEMFSTIHKLTESPYSGPAVVACMNGSRFCGQYIALHNLFEMINQDKEADIFQVVRQIKDSRPQFISTLDEYSHLHRVANQFVGDFDLYSNVTR